MTVEKQLQFLTDRAKDGLVFYTTYDTLSFINDELCFLDGSTWRKYDSDINELVNCKLGLDKGWTFTADEKAILKNIDKSFKWIARDEDNSLYVYYRKPVKAERYWGSTSEAEQITLFQHLFYTIQWIDGKPCDFRNYL